MPLHATFKVTTGGTTPQTYYFRGVQDTFPPAVCAIVGVNLAPADEQNRPKTKVEELVAKGVLIRLAASTGSSGGGTPKTVKLLASRNQLSQALDNLDGVTIRGNAITSVRVPQKATFY